MARGDWAGLPDAALLAQCGIDTYRASGPGGQKRNKTSSAVRLRHLPTGTLVIAEESRSQHENKAKALVRLRRQLYLDLREDPAPVSAVAEGRLNLGRKHPDFWPTAAVILDHLTAVGGRVSAAAAAVGVSTANLVGFLGQDPRLWQEANRVRSAAGLKPLQLT